MLFEQMREGALTVSPRGTMLYCNQAFATIVGTAAELLVGSSVLDLMARSDLDYLMASEGRDGCEMTLRRPAGGRVAAIISPPPLNEEGMRITCLSVTGLTRQQLRARYIRGACSRSRGD